MSLRTKLESGPYRISDSDALKLDAKAIYVVPDSNIFMHKYEDIQDLISGNLLS